MQADLGKRYPFTLVHGRHSTPVEVILRLLLCKHLYGWSYEETTERVADSLVLQTGATVLLPSNCDIVALIKGAIQGFTLFERTIISALVTNIFSY